MIARVIATTAGGLLLASAGVLGVAALAQGQSVDSTHDFQPGDIISLRAGDDSTYRITSCEAVTKRFRQCNVIRLTPYAEDHERPLVMENYTLSVVGHADGAKPAGAPPAAQPPAEVPDRETGASGQSSAAADGNSCPKTPYGGIVSGDRAPSAALFKQKIADSNTAAAYGHFWYGVRFDAFQMGAPIRNVVGVRAGDGANRVTNGAPANTTLYPVSVTVSVCEGAPNGSSSWRTRQSKYFCFVSANNEWTCGATN